MWQLEEWQQNCYRRTVELLTEVRRTDAKDFSTKYQIWWFFSIFLEAVTTLENHWEAPTICFSWKVGHILGPPGSCCKLLSCCTSGCTCQQIIMPSSLLPSLKSDMSFFHWQTLAWNHMLKRIPRNTVPTLRV